MLSCYADVLAVLDAYLDGLYRSDAALLASIFHPAALYAATTDGDVRFWTMEHYLPLVARRQSPEQRGERRDGKVLSVAFAGPNAAMAVVESSLGPRFYTDFVSLVRLDGRWLIAAKVFDSVAKPDAVAA